MHGWPTIGLGAVAGFLSTASYVPQLMKAWRERDTAALSKRMYIVAVTAFALWALYGFMIGSIPVAVFNLMSLLLSCTILVLKIRNERQDREARMPDREPGMARSG